MGGGGGSEWVLPYLGVFLDRRLQLEYESRRYAFKHFMAFLLQHSVKRSIRLLWLSFNNIHIETALLTEIVYIINCSVNDDQSFRLRVVTPTPQGSALLITYCNTFIVGSVPSAELEQLLIDRMFTVQHFICRHFEENKTKNRRYDIT